VTTRLRLLAGGTALVAGLWFLTAATAAPTLPKDTLKKVVEADIAALQKYIETCAADPKDAKRFGPTTRAQAMMLAMYAEAAGDAALRDEALKVAAVLDKKDWKAAGDLAKKLAFKAGAGPLKSGDLHTKHKFALDEVMSPFRGGTVGGMNIEKDLRALRDKKVEIDPAAVELLAARIAVLSEYASHMPNEKATGKKKDQWVKLSKDSIDQSAKLAAEAGKGKGANAAAIVKLATQIDRQCADCHKEFRDD
jgi:hypothetical protein